MKMDMKNKKTMLAAILVVAAFAAFSAAAVFEDSQSDAAATEISVDDITVVDAGTLTIKASTPSMSYGLTGTDVTVTIAKDAGWSGKLYFGAVSGDKFEVEVALELTGAGSMTFVKATSGGVVTYTVTGDAQGSVKMTEGMLQLGDATDAFNGTASGNTVEITSQNTGGLTIAATADKKTDQIYGDASSIENTVDENPVYAIDIDGNVKFVSGELKLNSYSGTDKLVVNINDTFDVILADIVNLDIYHTVVNVNGTLNIDGKVDLGAPAGGTAEFNINGTMKFTNVEDEATSGARMIRGADVNAAYYSTGSSEATTKFTHIYTTLENAMTASDTIFVTGEHFITKDTTLTGNSSAETPSNKITINSDATIYTGVDMDPNDDDAVFTSITVTVPVTTVLTINGTIDVQAGKLVWTATTTPTDAGSNIKADVFMVDGNNGIYTDLATALELSESGNTVAIRTSATSVEIKADATVKDGVTLNAAAAISGITVLEGVTFTVAGKVTGANNLTIKGILVLDSADIAFTAGKGLNLEEEGVLTFGQAFDNTATGAKKFEILADGEDTVINVYGKTMLTVNGLYGTFQGTVNVYNTLVFDADITIGTLFVADGGDVSAIDGTTAKTIAVTGLFTAGTAPEDLTQYVNGAKAKVALGSEATSIVYGKAAGVTVTGHEKTAYIFKDDSGSVVYATVTDGSSANTRIYSLEFPAVEGKAFQAWFSLPSLVDSSVVEADGIVGAFSEVYAGFADATITVNLQNVPNATWVINEKVYASGNQSIEWAESYTIVLVANNGYTADGVVLVEGAAFTGALSNGDSVTFDGDVKATASDDAGMDVQTVLLAVIAAAAVVMAIVFIIRMMRS